MGTDQKKCWYRSDSIDNHGHRSEKLCLQIRQCGRSWVQIRESVVTHQRKHGHRSENGYRSVTGYRIIIRTIHIIHFRKAKLCLKHIIFKCLNLSLALFPYVFISQSTVFQSCQNGATTAWVLTSIGSLRDSEPKASCSLLFQLICFGYKACHTLSS